MSDEGSGHPSAAKGQSQEVNHVSSTSGSETISREPHCSHFSGTLTETVSWPQGVQW